VLEYLGISPDGVAYPLPLVFMDNRLIPFDSMEIKDGAMNKSHPLGQHSMDKCIGEATKENMQKQVEISVLNKCFQPK